MTTRVPLPLSIIPIPPEFAATHIHHHTLIERLGLSGEQEFFARYLRGEIPPGVPLSAFLNQPLICWPLCDIEAWEADGRPRDELLASRTRRVIDSLRRCIENTYGRDLEDLVQEVSETN